MPRECLMVEHPSEGQPRFGGAAPKVAAPVVDDAGDEGRLARHGDDRRAAERHLVARAGARVPDRLRVPPLAIDDGVDCVGGEPDLGHALRTEDLTPPLGEGVLRGGRRQVPPFVSRMWQRGVKQSNRDAAMRSPWNEHVVAVAEGQVHGCHQAAGVVDERLERVASRAGVRVAELGEL